jgi:hypothetical protein
MNTQQSSHPLECICGEHRWQSREEKEFGVGKEEPEMRETWDRDVRGLDENSLRSRRRNWG